MHRGNEVYVTGTQYSEKFRARMVEKMAGPPPMTALALAGETGVCQSTLSRWLREAITLRQKMAKRQDDEEQKVAAADAPQRTTEEKFSLVLEAAAIPEAELGEWLRRKGVHVAQLEEWRAQAMAGIGGAAKRTKETASDARQIRQLERELARKDKALAEAAALLVLQKKVQAIWGDADDDTDEKKDK
jgi:transposase